MNISNINCKLSTQKLQSFKGNKETGPKDKDKNDEGESTAVFISPECYQAAKNINLRVKPLEIELKNGEKHILSINRETVENYLQGEDGKPDSKLVQNFAQIYKAILQSLINEEDSLTQRNLKFLLDDKKPENTAMREISTHILNTSGKRRDEFEYEAYTKTEMIFELSKISEGKYDGFKDLDKKKDIGNHIDKISNNFPRADVFPEINLVSRNEDGIFDAEFAEELCKILLASDFELSPYEIGEMLKYFIEKDPENADKITQAIIRVDHSGFLLFADGKSFKQLIEQCFDGDETFSETRYQTLLSAIDAIQNCWSFGSIWDNMPIGADDGEWIEYASDTIAEYFGEISGKKGRIEPEKCNMGEFFLRKEKEVARLFLE